MAGRSGDAAELAGGVGCCRCSAGVCAGRGRRVARVEHRDGVCGQEEGSSVLPPVLVQAGWLKH